MEFQSILGIHKYVRMKPEDIGIPRFFYDLNLDQVVGDIMEQQKLYDLREFYYNKATMEDTLYRLEVMKDFENALVCQSIVDFAIGMRKAKEYLNNITGSESVTQKQKWKLDAADYYIGCVMKLYNELDKAMLTSVGMKELLAWLSSYVTSPEFTRLQEDTLQLMKQFGEMKFNLQIKRDRVIINQGYLEEDYCKQLLDTFRVTTEEEHFYQKNPFGTIALSEMEQAVLRVLEKPYSQTFSELGEYDKKYQDFISEVLLDFERESQFYIAFRAYCEELKNMGFHFCYPEIRDNEFTIIDAYDLALAKKNALVKKEVIFNDCRFDEGEQFLVITGPNQGGKTTYARAIGQILFFGSIGLPVPARKAFIPVFEGIYTHFAAEESMDTGAGKLKEELVRLKNMMDKITKHSFVIINEIFTSATSYDAYIMGKKTIDYFMKSDCLGIYVTHIYELTKDDPRIVSMVASLLSEDSNIRTFRINRRKADGKSYANTIVEKHHMTYEEIKERIRR